jgi:gliding motility-associated-like protein
LFGFTSSLLAVDSPVILNRICPNFQDSIITLQWTNPSDTCMSFTGNRIYGREGTINPFVPMSGVIASGMNSWQLKLPNLNFSDWEFYIVTSLACNGIDSFNSNILSVDLSKPPISQIDSVSIDFITQKIIIGWQKNVAPDQKGYRIYQYLANTNSDSLSDTSSINYLLYQVTNNNIEITIAAYDSCNLYSPISSPHKTISLGTFFDTCTRRAFLNWSLYGGWSPQSYIVYYNQNGLGYKSLQSVPATTKSLLFDSTKLGDSICFYVRAFKSGDPATTSSSNISCVHTRAKITPSLNYINQVTVQNNNSILVNWSGNRLRDVAKAELFISKNNSPFVSTFSVPNPSLSFSFTDNNVSVSKDLAKYKVVLFDFCGEILNESNTSSNILLELKDKTLEWNDYAGWLGSNQGFSVFDGSGTTWKLLRPASLELTYLTTDEPNSSLTKCFYVQASEVNNPLGVNSYSESNIVCKIPLFSYYMPNTIIPGGVNDKFVIIGNNIDIEKSWFSIYNRWGERIFQSYSLSDAWYGQYRENIVPSGVYFYVAEIYSLNQERVTLTGEIRVLR